MLRWVVGGGFKGRVVLDSEEGSLVRGNSLGRVGESCMLLELEMATHERKILRTKIIKGFKGA